VILDTKGNIFGGFTPVEWESPPSNYYKADNSQKSFVFTLKNPRNIPARKFALKARWKDQAICCNSKCGPNFCDISVSDHCNSNTKSFTAFGESYTNDIAQDKHKFFTGSKTFQVIEIEVFEVMFCSQIIVGFPEIFNEFWGKRFSLLYLGSRDGFKNEEFHRRCDGHANTLTVILDTKGNIFGGFTPVEWESRVHNGKYGEEDNRFKADESEKSFIFILQVMNVFVNLFVSVIPFHRSETAENVPFRVQYHSQSVCVIVISAVKFRNTETIAIAAPQK
jgi:hypothetical protein